MTAGYDLMEALDHLDPRDLDYLDWCKVGMALHEEGYPSQVWRDWSMRDPERFNERDFESKWRGFGHGAGEKAKGGTIVKMARDAGWSPARPERPHRALDWDSWIGGHDGDEPTIVDPAMVGEFDADVKPMYSAGHGRDELRAFIDALFEDSEYVGYVIDYTEKEDEHGNVKLVPGSRGIYGRTAGEIKSALSGGMENGIGTTNGESGAWIRFNPLDGSGVGNANVTAYRFALLESDDMPIGKFAGIVRKLNLPVAAMVDSGGKSLHAIVRIDADDERTYRERVETLYARCERNGIEVDRANKNASRLCRMPGVTRNGRRQFLAGLAQGAADWDEWDEWYQAETDDLPDAAELDVDPDGERPEVAPALIEGILRVRDKMLLAGPSKAGKSFALMELCGALSTGGEWFGYRCRRSRVLYINLELTRDSCRARFHDVYSAMGIGPSDARNTVTWDLKGKGKALSKLAQALVRRAVKNEVEVCIIDPIYKVMAGDENNAKDIGEFTNTLDRIAEDAGISVIYCHHHSKGYQGEKRSIDRASGSGVFGRDADAVVDMIELDPEDEVRTRYVNSKCCAMCREAVVDAGRGDEWEALGSDVESVGQRALDEASRLLDGKTWAELAERCSEVTSNRYGITAWRIESTLREFPKTAPVFAWFDWPLHVIDPGLKGSPEMGSQPNGRKRKEKEDDPDPEHHAEIVEGIVAAFDQCIADGVEPTTGNVYDRMADTEHVKVTLNKVREWVKPRKAWCPIKTSDEYASDGKSKVLVNKMDGVVEKDVDNL